MNIRPEPVSIAIGPLRTGLLLIGLALLVERLWPGSRPVVGSSAVALGAGLVLIASSIRPARSEPIAEPPTPEPPRVDPTQRIADLRERLQAAKQVADPERVLDYRDELTTLLADEERRALDRETLAYLMTLIQRRLRGGTARADVAGLAARAAERFGATPEGASLRASLPTLRRAAGLCQKCGRPYAGLAESCPECQTP